LTPFTPCIGGGDGWPGSCCTLILGNIAACPCTFTGTGGEEEVVVLGVEDAVVVFAGVVTLFGLNPEFIVFFFLEKYDLSCLYKYVPVSALSVGCPLLLVPVGAISCPVPRQLFHDAFLVCQIFFFLLIPKKTFVCLFLGS
jgi:hypothetical protein